MIYGNKTTLRAIEQEDCANYYTWINDTETNQRRGLYHPTSKEEAAAWIEVERKKRPDALSLSIDVHKKHIGFIGLRGICPRSQRGEIWIYIGDKAHWGQGIGQDAVQALCNYAFSQMNLHRIWLECNPQFITVVRCYESVGFKQEGLLRDGYFRDGKFHNTCIMALLSTDEEIEGKANG